MSSKELIALLLRVITSWQVIVVTVVVFLYFFLVSYVAKLYRRSPLRFSSPAKSKKQKPSPPEPKAAEFDNEENTDDELGLEEE
ncbi:MAG: hypothetical protein LBK02_00735 [Treponema sp.]|jgi:hypothetical protein|nr:hypothetical protein [Treponema sp.]